MTADKITENIKRQEFITALKQSKTEEEMDSIIRKNIKLIDLDINHFIKQKRIEFYS
ncbi:MAG: hypothetical protein ACOCUL_02615 [Bacteroidota bacterium]